MIESLSEDAARIPTDSTASAQETQVDAAPAPAESPARDESKLEERGPSGGEHVEAGVSASASTGSKVAEEGNSRGKSGNTSEEEVDTLVGEAVAPSPKGEPVLVVENAAQGPSDPAPQPPSVAELTSVDVTTPAPEADASLAPPPDAPQPGSTSAVASPVVREASPASRTSTPPLGSGLPAKKKFSSVNVNKQFLSKAASPAPAAGATKATALNGRPAASPVPATSSASRHLSTKLSTIPASSKPTPSPSLPAPSLSSSPWAKPSPTPGDPQPADTLHQPAPTKMPSGSFSAGLGGVGQGGLGIAQAAAAGRTAWRAVGSEGRGLGSTGGMGGGVGMSAGLSRDFPTAKEVADGQKKAQLAAQAIAAHNQAAAQAVAAHNQAILQGLNAFTQLDPNAHRWDEEDEEDDVIDFGDAPPSSHFPSTTTTTTTTTTTAPPPHRQQQSESSQDRPVSKSERFAEDFDRSWPRRPAERERVDRVDKVERAEREPVGSRRGEEGRVLFNASSNRLESGTGRQSQGSGQGQGYGGPAPTRLMSRPNPASAGVGAGTGRGGLDRALPPHLQELSSGSGSGAGSDAAGERMLPPHMAASSSTPADHFHTQPSHPTTGLTQLNPRTQPQTQLPSIPSGLPTRTAWSRDREPVAERGERGVGSWLDHKELPAQSSAPEHAHSNAYARDVRSPEKQTVALPRRSFSQTVRPAGATLPPPPTLPAIPTSHPASTAHAHPPTVTPAAPTGGSTSADEFDPQAAEMHTAAEKARLRRLAEEAEREAAAERARMKAKALEERLRGASGEGGAGEKDVPPAGRPQPPPGLEKSLPLPASRPQQSQQPQITLAQRPRPDLGLPPVPVHAQGLPTPGQGTERQSRAGMEASWRARVGPKPQEEAGAGRKEILSPPTGPRAQQGLGEHLPLAPPVLAIPTGPSIDAQAISPGGGASGDPAQGKKESSFDGMLARIQAAMKEARERESAVTSVQPPLPGSPEKPEPRAVAGVTQPTVLTRGQGLLQGGRQLPPHQSLPAAPAPGGASTTPAAGVEGKGKDIPGLPQAPATVPDQVKQTGVETPKVKSAAATSAAPAPAPTPAPPILPLLEELFDVTCVVPPRSPPPAWRTYTIKIPKLACSHLSLSPASAPASASGPAGVRLQSQPAVVAAVPLAPKGWAMSFEPAIDGLNPTTLSLSELLLPQPVRGRFAKPMPIVSISPRTLDKVEKKGKKGMGIVGEVFDLPGAVKGSAGDEGRGREEARATREKVPSPVPEPAALASEAAAPVEPAQSSAVVPDTSSRKTKSPVKTSAAAKAEREGRFGLDGVSGVGIDKSDRALASVPDTSGAGAGEGQDKPLVRFTVSSELEEGERQEEDSLLDEVNKMSLERVEEGDDKKEEGKVEAVQGAETPKTPPAPSSPSKSNGSATPWSKAPLAFNPTHTARSASQHDHALRSVWDAPAPSASQSTTSSTIDASTPMYPTLNAPSSADPPAKQPLATGMKTSFSHTHAFSSPVVSAPTLTSASSYSRHPSVPSPYAQFGSPHSLTSPESGHNLMALSYSSMSRPGVAVGVNPGVNGFQQGVWSPTAFGTSMASPAYGYSAQQQQQQQQQAQGKMAGGNYQSGVYANFVPLHQQHAQAQAHAQQQQQQQQQQQYSAPGYGRGQTTPGVNVGMYGFGYGAPGQAQMRPHGGRFAQAQANGEYQHQQHQHQHQHQSSVVAGQGVSGVGAGVGGYGMAMDGSSQGAQAPGQGYYGGMYPQGQAVTAGVGSPRMQQQPGYAGRQHGAGAVGQQGRGVGARKW